MMAKKFYLKNKQTNLILQEWVTILHQPQANTLNKLHICLEEIRASAKKVWEADMNSPQILAL